MIYKHYRLQGSAVLNLPYGAKLTEVSPGSNGVNFHFAYERRTILQKKPAEQRAFELILSFEDFPERYELIGEFMFEVCGILRPVTVVEVPVIDLVNRMREHGKEEMIRAARAQYA
ncbi:hypothetical protein F7U66_01855 [Vibrio parahaemolyticus]|nr:hypothetical protein [Vibrio parahaemolyticus]